MPTTERTLKKWRKEALEDNEKLDQTEFKLERGAAYRELCNCILRLTQELLNNHLLRKK